MLYFIWIMHTCLNEVRWLNLKKKNSSMAGKTRYRDDLPKAKINTNNKIRYCV